MRQHEQRSDQAAEKPRRVDLSQASAALAGPLSPAAVLGLQRLVGNAAVVQRLAGHEHVDGCCGSGAAVQRTAVHQALGSSGRPLDEDVRSEMEGRLSADFSDVRVHTDATAHAAAESVQAHAFTSGSHIVFQRGRFDTASSAGKRMLAHELTHVVQQRSGPVAGTETADGLKVSDPADRFEREAEATAASAMSAPAPLQRSGDTSERTVPDPAYGTLPVVQRAVGFEFETGWKVMYYEPNKFPRWLKKKEKIGQPFDGFKLEADEAAGNESEVEFIVDPPIPEGTEGLDRLDNVMTQIEELGQRMEGVAGQSVRYFYFNRASGREPDFQYHIYPTQDHKLKAGPQVTSGLDLAKIPELETVSRQGPAVSAELAPTVTGLQERATEMKDIDGHELSPSLKGLLAILTGYLDAGGTRHKNNLSNLDLDTQHSIALNYPKQIGDVLLARTNLVTLFTLLPGDEQTYWKADHDRWIKLVLENTNSDLQLQPGDSIISRGIKVDENDPTKGVTTPDLTIEQWLRGILDGTDYLQQVQGAESMGEFGSKTEEVGGTSPTGQPARGVGIFEFRGAQSQKIPLARWGDFAREFHRYITQVHGG